MQQLNYYTLQALARWLAPRLQSGHFVEAFSQQKDELVLAFAGAAGEDVYLRFGCRPQLPYLVPTGIFSRQRANVASVFAGLNGTEVLAVRSIEGERILVLELAGQAQLVLKAHGGRSNAVLLAAGKAVDQFRHNLGDDEMLVLPTPRPVGFADEGMLNAALAANPGALKAAYPGFDAAMWDRLADYIETGHTIWQALQTLLAELEDSTYYVSRLPTGAAFWLLELPSHLKQPPETTDSYTDLAEALLAWLRLSLGRADAAQQKETLSQLLGATLDKTQRTLRSIRTTLAKTDSQRSREELANLIMAGLHAIPAGAAEVQLPDIYDPASPLITLQLDPLKSAQDNAAHLYALHKEDQRRVVHLQSQLKDLLAQEATLQAALAELAPLDRPKDLQAFAKKNAGLLTLATRPSEEVEHLPYRVFRYQGYEIRVGKDAKRNDELTLRHSHKDDLWLHARDAPGSHVILRQQAGQNVPTTVLEYAAGLAAWYSKRRSEGMVPVSYTPRKYVRKTKHLAPGMVIIERESTLLIEPLNPEG